MPLVDEMTFEQEVMQTGSPVFVCVADRPCVHCLADQADWVRSGARGFCLDPHHSWELAARLEVHYLLTILLFRCGNVVRRLIGQPLPDDLNMIVRTAYSRTSKP